MKTLFALSVVLLLGGDARAQQVIHGKIDGTAATLPGPTLRGDFLAQTTRVGSFNGAFALTPTAGVMRLNDLTQLQLTSTAGATDFSRPVAYTFVGVVRGRRVVGQGVLTVSGGRWVFVF